MTATITGPVAAKVRTATRDAVTLLRQTPRMGRRCAASKATEDNDMGPQGAVTIERVLVGDLEVVPDA